MRFILLVLTIIIAISFAGCGNEQKTEPVARVDKSQNPRFADLNPRAWEGLPMEVLMSDFQHSDGIFSSFICDEINKRLSSDPSGSLGELKLIDKESRTRAFKLCLSPEIGAPPEVLNAVNKYANEYPDLVNEILEAAE